MKKINILFAIVSILILISCNRTDFSNPEDVITHYRNLSWEYKDDALYEDFLSIKSKEFVTKDEYIKSRQTSDSIMDATKLLDTKISTYPIDINNPTFRRFKVDETSLFNSDTVYSRLYYTLQNENGRWKIVWTETLLSFAARKFYDGNYLESRKTLEKIIEINPFSGGAYDQLAWSYYRDHSLSRYEWENGVVKNAKYAISLEEDDCSHYNTLGAYYSEIGNSDLAIQYFERGLQYCKSNNEKALFYSNLVVSYMLKQDYEQAEEYAKKSVKIDDKNAFIWFKYGTLMLAQNKRDEGKVLIEKALKCEKMENSIQGSLYYTYAICCLDKTNYEVANEYINKALDIEPNNASYQMLYDQIRKSKLKAN